MKLRTCCRLTGRFLVLAAIASASAGACAAVVCNSTPAPVPPDLSGIYIDLVTGVTSTIAFSGADINPYNNGIGGPDDGFQFFNLSDGFILGPGQTAAILEPGSVVGPTADFTGPGQADATAFRVTGTRIAGVKFFNELAGNINYGWFEVSTNTGTAPSQGFPATITRWCYQDNGSEIMAGTTPVALQSFTID